MLYSLSTVVWGSQVPIYGIHSSRQSTDLVAQALNDPYVKALRLACTMFKVSHVQRGYLVLGINLGINKTRALEWVLDFGYQQKWCP